MLSETRDGGAIRVRQIQDMIQNSKFSIHDISRILPKSWNFETESAIKQERDYLPRFNMPFELGLDLGCKQYLKKDKRCLILEEKQYRFKEVISDIAGQDISFHSNEPSSMVKAVRDWIYKNSENQKPEAYTIIWDIYNEFEYDLINKLEENKLDPSKMWEIPFSELIDIMKDWISARRK